MQQSDRRREASKYDVVFLPIIDWAHRFQRPQHIASAFARDGHRVFYCGVTFVGFNKGVSVSPVDGIEHLWHVSLPGPRPHNRFTDPLTDEDVAAISEGLEHLANIADIRDALLMVQQPMWTRVAKRVRDQMCWPIVYDCMDEHSGLTSLNVEITKQESELAQTSSLVVVSSNGLLKKLEAISHAVELIPNACDFTHFATATAHCILKPRDSPTTPVIGYYGAIMEWFDAEMMLQLAEMRPDLTFEFIGAVDLATPALEALRTRPNVKFHGEQPYDLLPKWLATFDVAIIPFLLTPIIQATNPVKFYEYLAAGKPVVSTPLPELDGLQSLHYRASGAESFSRAIDEALRDNCAAFVSARQQWASVHTWARRYSQFKEAIAANVPLVSIVIVSHEAKEHLSACLDSIKRFTGWPRYEVLVVDNASGHGVRDYLSAVAEGDSRLRVLFQDTNLGFAAANNVGLRLCNGDSRFVVLLNNDVVVTEGWLSGLLRWCCRHDVGLVGPRTRPAGVANEAALAIAYETSEEMHERSRLYTCAHRGEAFDIPMLAMYCVAGRREVFRLIGNLDEGYGRGMFEDDDYSMRVRAHGLRLVCAEDVFVHHEGSVSFKALPSGEYEELFSVNRKRFENKWGIRWARPVERRVMPDLGVSSDVAREEPGFGQDGRNPPRVAICIVTYNSVEHLGPLLESLDGLDYSASHIELVLVDNLSTDNTVHEVLRRRPDATVIKNEGNVGFAEACNQAARSAKSEYAVFLNADMRVDRHWLRELVVMLRRSPNVGVAGSLVMTWAGDGVDFGGRWDDAFSFGFQPSPVSLRRECLDESNQLFVSGGAMIVRRSEFLELGGFDPRYFMYQEDVDLCWRYWLQGKRCVLAPASVVFHKGGGSASAVGGITVHGWSQRNLLWTLLKNCEAETLWTNLPAAVMAIIERGRWSKECRMGMQKELEHFFAGLASVLSTRANLQATRKWSDLLIIQATGCDFGGFLKHPVLFEMTDRVKQLLERDGWRLRVDRWTDPGSVRQFVEKVFEVGLAVAKNETSESVWHARRFAARHRVACNRESGEEIGVGLAAARGTRMDSDRVELADWGPQILDRKEFRSDAQETSFAIWIRGSGLSRVRGLYANGGKLQCVHGDGVLTATIPQEIIEAASLGDGIDLVGVLASMETLVVGRIALQS